MYYIYIYIYMETLRLSWTQEGGAPKHTFSTGNIRGPGALAHFRHPGGQLLAKFLTCSMQVERAVRTRSELPDSEKKRVTCGGVGFMKDGRKGAGAAGLLVKTDVC